MRNPNDAATPIANLQKNISIFIKIYFFFRHYQKDGSDKAGDWEACLNSKKKANGAINGTAIVLL